MITINAEDFFNLQPEAWLQYRAAANFIKKANTTTDLFRKRELLVEARGHLVEVKDSQKIELLDNDIASISESITASLATTSTINLGGF
jgi:hypothetical protein